MSSIICLTTTQTNIRVVVGGWKSHVITIQSRVPRQHIPNLFHLCIYSLDNKDEIPRHKKNFFKYIYIYMHNSRVFIVVGTLIGIPSLYIYIYKDGILPINQTNG